MCTIAHNWLQLKLRFVWLKELGEGKIRLMLFTEFCQCIILRSKKSMCVGVGVGAWATHRCLNVCVYSCVKCVCFGSVWQVTLGATVWMHACWTLVNTHPAACAGLMVTHVNVDTTTTGSTASTGSFYFNLQSDLLSILTLHGLSPE